MPRRWSRPRQLRIRRSGRPRVGADRARRGSSTQREGEIAAAALLNDSRRRLGPRHRLVARDQARSRALVSSGDVAERQYREAIDQLTRTRVRVELARAHLLYGEWLLRERPAHGRPRAAACRPRHAESIGADGFAERGRLELMAAGETVRKHTRTPDELTAQEAQIARLAGEGRTNPEIGAELFLSPRTVEWHLRKVFTKLGHHLTQRARARRCPNPLLPFRALPMKTHGGRPRQYAE